MSDGWMHELDWIGWDWMVETWDGITEELGEKALFSEIPDTRYPKYPKILKKFRVWIRYWKKIWVRVGYQVPAGHWSHSDPATTAPKEQKRRTCLNTSVYSAGSKQTIIVVCYYKQSTAVSAGLC